MGEPQALPCSWLITKAALQREFVPMLQNALDCCPELSPQLSPLRASVPLFLKTTVTLDQGHLDLILTCLPAKTQFPNEVTF